MERIELQQWECFNCKGLFMQPTTTTTLRCGIPCPMCLSRRTERFIERPTPPKPKDTRHTLLSAPTNYRLACLKNAHRKHLGQR